MLPIVDILGARNEGVRPLRLNLVCFGPVYLFSGCENIVNSSA